MKFLSMILYVALVWVTGTEALEEVELSDVGEGQGIQSGEHDSEHHHDHGDEAQPRFVEGRSDEDHGEHRDIEDSQPHEGETTVVVSDSGIGMAGIKLATVTRRRLTESVMLPGEIAFNEDRLAHITPRYSGVVKEVIRGLGEFVEKDATLAIIESNQSLTQYAVRAPLSGHIIEKHATPGEYLSEETSMYVIADLSSVWVNLDVYPRHLGLVSVGSKVTIRAVSMNREAAGVVSYVAPLFDQAKRAVVARMVLTNVDSEWRPGLFVSAELEIATEDSVMCVEKDAVQLIDGETHVFVPLERNRYQPVEIAVGNSGEKYVQILSGLSPGDSYVAHGAFQLKAEMITSSLGAHAGHGH